MSDQQETCEGELDAPRAPTAPPEFGDPEYWENLYADPDEDEAFDWLIGWNELAPLLEPLLARDHSRKVLHLGCGNSTLAEDLYDNGYRWQTNVDVSPTVIQRMLVRNQQARPEMRWIVGDATNLGGDLEEEYFDLVAEKSTLDALMCHNQHAVCVGRLLWEACRVLARNGIFLSVSMHGPRHLMCWLRQPAFDWNVRVVELPDTGHGSPAQLRPLRKGQRRVNSHYVYICSKRSHVERRPLWESLLRRIEAHPDSDVSTPNSTSSDDESD